MQKIPLPSDMEQLHKGQFYGRTNSTLELGGLILTDTVYTQEKVDWHYHQNPYITFILQGSLVEGNKKEIYNCAPGSLLFHNWQEPHYNLKPSGYSRGFHIEFEKKWTDNLGFELQDIQGNIKVCNPELKLVLYQVFKETMINDELSELSINELLSKVWDGILGTQVLSMKKIPGWVGHIKKLLHDECSKKHTLHDLSTAVGIHPGHLSRDFGKYFQSGLGDYIRKLRIEKSLGLLADKRYSLTDVTFECGFADQSHFGRCFRKRFKVSPSAYRKILIG